MVKQTKEPPFVPISSKMHEEMKANAPSFSQSMLNITSHMGTKPTVKTITGTRTFTDKYGQTFQEMKHGKTNKKIVAE